MKAKRPDRRRGGELHLRVLPWRAAAMGRARRCSEGATSYELVHKRITPVVAGDLRVKQESEIAFDLHDA